MTSALGPRLFGSVPRTRVLLTVALLESSYPREIARVAGVPLQSVQRIVDDLERQRVLASRLRGRQREVRLDPSFYASSELRSLLLRLSDGDPALTETVESLRRRPRRARKPL